MALPIRFEQEPDTPPGTGLFTFDDGRSVFAHEPELAGRLANQPDLRTAMVPATNRSDPNRQASDVAAPTPGVPTERVGRQPTPAEVDDYHRQLTPADVNGPAPQQPTSGMGQVQLPGGAVSQGTPSEPPPLVHQAARPGGFIPQGTKVVTEAGPAYSLEDAADRAAANRAVVKANLANFEAQESGARAEALQNNVRGQELAVRQQEQQRDLAAKQQRYSEERARLGAHVQAAEERKIDPKRFYKEQGTAGNIALVIGQALGAFGASLNHTDNWAANIVNRANEQDIAAQEDEIKSGRIAKTNALARFTEDFGGDIEQAKSALKMTQLAAVDAQIKEQAAWAKAPEAQRAAQLWLAQNQQARLAEEQKFQQLSMGKTVTEQTAKFQAPQAGGSRQMTPEEEAKYWKAKAEGKKYRGQYEGNVLDETDQKAVERHGKLRQGPENMAAQISDIVSLAGGEIGKDGRVKLPDDVPGVGAVKSHVPAWALSDTGRDIRQTANNIAADVVKDKSGAAATDAERKFLLGVLQGGGFKTPRELERGLTIYNQYSQRKIHNIESSFPAWVRQSYRSNSRESNRELYSEQPGEDDVEELR